jgi:hypothetical protein
MGCCESTPPWWLGRRFPHGDLWTSSPPMRLTVAMHVNVSVSNFRSAIGSWQSLAVHLHIILVMIFCLVWGFIHFIHKNCEWMAIRPNYKANFFFFAPLRGQGDQSTPCTRGIMPTVVTMNLSSLHDRYLDYQHRWFRLTWHQNGPALAVVAFRHGNSDRLMEGVQSTHEAESATDLMELKKDHVVCTGCVCGEFEWDSLALLLREHGIYIARYLFIGSK